MPDLAQWPARVTLRWVTAAALAVTLCIFAILAAYDRGLRPYSIVAFELAWTPAEASAMLGQWSAAGRQLARASLLLDFVFMPAYVLLLAGLVVLEARRSVGGLQRLGLRLALAPFAAWLLDALENVALLGVLAAPTAPPAPLTVTAALCATLKFVLLAACALYIIFTLAYRLGLWLGRRSR
jgi:hypothetical protein